MDDNRGRTRLTALLRWTAFAIVPVMLLVTAGKAQQQNLPASIGPAQLQQLQQQIGRGGVQAGTVSDQPTTIFLQPEAAVPPPTPSRLEYIMSRRAGAELALFGYAAMGAGRPVTVAQTGAVQDDYILGPGDEVVVSLRGQENSELRQTVNRDGQLVLPRLNPVPASGRSLGSVRQDIETAISRAYVATSASISVGRVRQISVLVSGEVVTPGQRTLSGLSSVADALLLSGGVKKSGSLRNVRLQRGGRQYPIDLYSILNGNGSTGAMRLTDGDRILVPLLGPAVAITGLVRRPGIYELPAGQKSIGVNALMSLAGGEEVRGRYRYSLLQVLADGRSEMVALPNEGGTVRDSEILFVQLGADQTVSQAILGGGTGLAGAVPVVPGSRLSQWIRTPGALSPSAYTLFGILVRRDTLTMQRNLLGFTPVAILAGREDIPVQSDDFIRPLSVNEARLLGFVANSYLERLASAQDAIRNPLGQALPDSNNGLINTLRSQTGQTADRPLEDTFSVPADIQRREIVALLDEPLPGSPLAERRLRAERLALQRQQQLQLQQAAQQSGATTRPPTAVPTQAITASAPESADEERELSYAEKQYSAPNYILQNPGEGQYAVNREVETFGQLVRQLDVDPLVLINFLVDHRIRLEGAVRGPGYYFAGPSATASDLLQTAGGTVNWADNSNVELITTVVDNQDGRSQTLRRILPRATLVSYVLRPRDQIRFSQISSNLTGGYVTIQGEVRNPGTFSVLRGERLSEVLARAGGLSNVAYPAGTVFLRRSAAEAEREGYTRAAAEVQNQLVIAMTRVGNDRIDPNIFTSMQTFVSELRNQRALGRISIVAEPSVLAANPQLDPLMEPGDVVYVPQRPSTVSVLGQVLQPGSYPYVPSMSLGDYIAQAGGYSTIADASQTFVVMPDGSARRVERSWLNFSPGAVLPPGSVIVVPRNMAPLDLRQTIIDVSQIFSQLAVSIASIAVISKQ